jgi:hypothetical protein
VGVSTMERGSLYCYSCWDNKYLTERCMAWPGPTQQSPPPPSHFVLYEFSKLTCCRLGYLQYPDNYVFVMSRNSKLCS